MPVQDRHHVVDVRAAIGRCPEGEDDDGPKLARCLQLTEQLLAGAPLPTHGGLDVDAGMSCWSGVW